MLFIKQKTAWKNPKRMPDCEGYKQLLSAGRMENVPQIEDGLEPTAEESDSKVEFLKMISRGGLLKPSNSLNILCCHAPSLFLKLTDTEENKKLLVSSTINPRSVYVEVLIRKLESCVNTKGLLEIKCSNDHALNVYMKRIGKTMFNLFAKNLQVKKILGFKHPESVQ